MKNVKDLIKITRSISAQDADLISRAFSFAERIHKEQRLFDAIPFFDHVYEVAYILAALGMDAKTITAGLLHDVLEDDLISKDELKKEFGEEITFLVHGVTKLRAYRYKGVERHAESLRQFLFATSKDARVLVIRFADRLHKMRVLGHASPEKQKSVALDTLEIYAPLANRLGIGQFKGELEDLAFPFVYPKEHEETKKMLREKSHENQKYLERVYRDLHKELAKKNIYPLKTDYRIKHIYSLYKKLQRYDMDIEKIYDIAALRIVMPTESECYQVLGIVHELWRPLPGRIKDYIAVPKPNGYQSLHTTIFTGDGGIAEIQIRTLEMHNEAEFGIASHLGYKEVSNRARGEKLKKRLSWIAQIVEWQKNVSESKEFLETLKMDFFKDRVFVFTPKGDVIDLPEDSSPVDFAYTIHSDIGKHMAGARVNDKMVSFDTKLKNGDKVEIITKKSASPSQKWLSCVKTSIARKHIKAATQKK